MSAAPLSAPPGRAPLGAELLALVRLGGPLVATQMGFTLIGVVDSALLGHVSANALAASSLATQWSWVCLSLGLGVVLGIDPLIAQAHGAGDRAATALALQRGLVMAVIAGVPVAALHLVTEQGLLLLGQPPEIAAEAQRYNAIRAASLPFFYVFVALRSWLSGRTLVAPALFVVLAVNVVNALAGYALVFGHFGFPRLELTGAALVAAGVAILQPFLLWGWVRLRGLDEGVQLWPQRAALSLRGLGQVGRLGLPVGFQIALEAWGWSFSVFMAGWGGAQVVAAHAILINLISLVYQLGLGIALAATVRVGNCIGASDLAAARRAAAVAVSSTALLMGLLALAVVVLRDVLPHLYTDDLAVAALAASVAPIAAATQLFDGLQIVAAGILRGAGRTQAPAYVNLFCFGAIVLPLAYVFGYRFAWGLAGIWSGFVVGVSIIALLMLLWARRTTSLPLEELQLRVQS
jgi:multidrug resistance protein, MATE family